LRAWEILQEIRTVLIFVDGVMMPIVGRVMRLSIFGI
jgi:hypothetical protein